MDPGGPGGCRRASGRPQWPSRRLVELAAMFKPVTTENHGPSDQHRRDLPELPLQIGATHFLPLFAERFARQRLGALAQVEG